MEQISDDIVHVTCKAPAVEKSTCEFKKDGMNAVLEGCKTKCDLVEETYKTSDMFSIEEEAMFGGGGGSSVSFYTYKYPGVERVEATGCRDVDFTQEETKTGKTRSRLYISSGSMLDCSIDDEGKLLKCKC